MSTALTNDPQLTRYVDNYLAASIRRVSAKRSAKRERKKLKEAKLELLARTLELSFAWKSGTVWHDAETGRDFENPDELTAELGARAKNQAHALADRGITLQEEDHDAG